MEIFDNYIPERIRNDLVHDKEYQERPLGMYTFWDMKDFNKPNSKIEWALHHIWKDRINKYDFRNGGIEWWINKSDGPASNPWHLDLVEAEQDEVYEPASLTVAYYPWIDCVGGFLEILDNQKSKSKQEFRMTLRSMDPHTQVERIKPKTNRAVFYDSYRIHRVARIYSGRRECLASSAWIKKPLTFNDKSSYNI